MLILMFFANEIPNLNFSEERFCGFVSSFVSFLVCVMCVEAATLPSSEEGEAVLADLDMEQQTGSKEGWGKFSLPVIL